MDKYLQGLLLEIKTLIFPGLGAITITNENTGELMFMSYLKFDDGKLAKFMAEKEGMTELDAKNVVGKYVQNIIQTLDRGEKYSMYQFGEFHKDQNGEIQFQAWNTSAPESIETNSVETSTATIVLTDITEVSIPDNKTEEIISNLNFEIETNPSEKVVVEEENISPEISFEIEANTEKVEDVLDFESPNLEAPKADVSPFELNDLDALLNDQTKVSNTVSNLDDLLGNIEEEIMPKHDIPFEIVVNEEEKEESELVIPSENSIQVEEHYIIEEKIPTFEKDVTAMQEVEKASDPIDEVTLTESPIVEQPAIISAAIDLTKNTQNTDENSISLNSTEEKTFDEAYQEKLREQAQITVIAPRKKKKWIYFVAPLLLLATLYLIGLTKYHTLSKTFPIMEKYAFLFGQKSKPDFVKPEKETVSEDVNTIINDAQATETPDESENVSSDKIPVTNDSGMESNGNKGDNGTPAYEEPKPVVKEVSEKPKPEPKPSSNGNYHIVVGSFGNEDNANRLAKKIGGSVIGQTSGGLFMVSALSYGSKSEAKDALADVQATYSGAYVFGKK